MSKRLILVLALALVVGLSFTAYAEVQNVKVSGDLTVQGVARDNFDLEKPISSALGLLAGDFNDKESGILSITRVRVDADLTDNVSTTVRLLNERNWNGEERTLGAANRNIGLNTAPASNADANDVDLDLAYVTLKEFLYSPLSLTIGRQSLRFGNGLVVGDPDTNIYSSATELAEGDLSARKSFDALRATLDYNPLVVDMIYAKVEEGAANLNDDVSLGGINANYALNKNTTVEGFLFSKVTGTNSAAVTNVDSGNATFFTAGTDNFPLKDKADVVNTIGARVLDKTVKNLTLDVQGAYQFGTYNPKFDPNARVSPAAQRGPNAKAQTSKRSAWATQIMATYDLKDMAMLSKYSPAISGSYTYLSGANRDETRSGEAYKGWDPMFEDQTVGHIMNAIFAESNMHRGSLSANAKLTDDISANVNYIGAWFAKRYPRNADRRAILSEVSTARQFTLKGDKFIGQEIDASLTYDYTEDVQFSLLGGIFLPGRNIVSVARADRDGQAAATELIGSMKVTF